MNTMKSFKVDNLIKGYKILKQVSVPEFKMTAIELQHMKTNAKHIHLDRDDNNKTFGVLFRTPAPNSSGVPHILEHTVLCGSQKYPVRDPFFKMITRSQATFMNAMTASDWTLYPFSSMNDKDFMNLLSLYLDAVFKPLLDETNFMQEGWRLEPKDLKSANIKSSFELKGVVYNEMKGVFSDSLSNFAHQCENNLLPKSYPFISGGDPPAIPDLSYEQLKQFHFQLYHPSNSKFITYGNINLNEVLEIIDSEYLSKYDPINVTTSIPVEPKWLQPRSINVECGPDPMASNQSKQCSVAVSYAIDDCHDNYLNFCMNIISYLLVNGDNAPLYQALIESELASDWIGHLCGFDGSTRTSTFHVGVKGVQQDQIDHVESVILNVIKETAICGFPKERIDSTLHQIELGIRHDQSDFGLKVMLNLTSGVNHEAPLADLLKSLEYSDRLRLQLQQDETYLQKLISKYLVENNHRLTSKMTPSDSYEEAKKAKEQKLVERLNAQLTDGKKSQYIEKCKKLEENQLMKENIDCLPSLNINDIKPTIEQFPIKFAHNDIQVNIASTNGIMYLRCLFDLSGIPDDLVPYIPLFTSMFKSMSTSRMNYREIDQALESCSGGLSSGLNLTGHIISPSDDDSSYGLIMSSSCLLRNRSDLLDLITEIITEVRFDDVVRLANLIGQEAAACWSSNSIAGSAHRFAMRRANASLSNLGRLNEAWNGFDQATFIIQLSQLSQQQLLEQIVPQLNRLKSLVFNSKRMKMAVNVESQAEESTLSLLKTFKERLPQSDYSKSAITMATLSNNNQTHIVLPYSVNYCATAIKSVPFLHEDYAKTRVLSKLLSSKYLLREVREKGGAYGVGAISSPGYFNFFSYRDPNNIETLPKFIDSLNWILLEEISQQYLDEAKLSVFQETDMPLSAGKKGLAFFLNNITDEMRQHQRDQLFEVTTKDLVGVSQKLIDLSNSSNSSSNVIIGPETDSLINMIKLKF